MDEKKYPIYEFWVRFKDDKDHNVVGVKMLEEVPCCWEDFLAVFVDWVDANLDGEHHGPGGTYTIRSLNLEIIDAGWKFLREETWCCGWFQHYTYNTHLSDEELLESFREYVERQRPYICGSDEPYDCYLERVPKDRRVCLMGAEDHWRWKEPCRCEHCRERGVVMIDH